MSSKRPKRERKARRQAVSPDAEHLLAGRQAWVAGDLPAAQRSFAQAVRAAPESAAGFECLGHAFAVQGQVARAQVCFERALERDPTARGAWLGSGRLWLAREDGPRAAEALERAAGEDSRDAALWTDLGNARILARDLDGARRAARRALELEPGLSGALCVQGLCAEFSGDLELCVQKYRASIAGDPGQTGAIYKLSRNRHYGDDAGVAELEQRLADWEHGPCAGPDSARHRRDLHFALASAHDQRGESAAAFRHASAGNTLTRTDYQRDERGPLLEQMRSTFDAQSLRASLADAQVPTAGQAAPIFILGLPRSGTSLLEQILVEHPAVAGRGEDPFLAAAAAQASSDGVFPRGLGRAPQAVFDRIARGYHQGCPQAQAARSVDKAMDLIYLVGVIVRAFPDACLIHIRRDPRDVFLSCFLTHFGPNRCKFATDFDDLVAYHREFEQLLAHWREQLPGRIHELEYEQLTQEPEATLRALLRACRLPWHAGCLDYHEGGRAVLTASSAQVREPLHGRARGRWRGYESELRAALPAAYFPESAASSQKIA